MNAPLLNALLPHTPTAAPGAIMAMARRNGKRLLVILADEDNPLLPDLASLGSSAGVAQAVSAKEMALAIDAAIGHGICCKKAAELLAMAPERIRGDHTADNPEPLGKLSPRERQVALLATQGMSNVSIARQTATSRFTVRNQLCRAMAKLGVRNRIELSTLVVRETATPR